MDEDSYDDNGLNFYLKNALQDIPNSQQILILMISSNMNLTKGLMILIMTMTIQQIIDSLKFLKTIYILLWNHFKTRILYTQPIIIDFYG